MPVENVRGTIQHAMLIHYPVLLLMNAYQIPVMPVMNVEVKI